MLGMRDLGSMIGEDERARAVGRLGLAFGQAALPDRRCLLIADQSADRNLEPEQRAIGARDLSMRVDHFRQRLDRHAEQIAQIGRKPCLAQRQ